MDGSKYVNVLAGIVTFNPSVKRLKDNIIAVSNQVREIVVIDNASKNQHDVENLICELKGVGVVAQIIINNSNCGLGKALNQMFDYARNYEFKWVIMLDQDSVISLDYIAKAMCYFDTKDIGIIASSFYEKNLGRPMVKENTRFKYSLINRCITSASIVRVEAYNMTSGFDEDMFIDYVDFDFSIKVRQAGYKILRMNDTVFEHELGQSRKKRFLFWEFRLTSHSADREYWIARNIIVFIKRYYKYEPVIRDFFSLCKHFVLVVLYEHDEKAKKLRALCKGVHAGIRFSE